MNKIKDEELNEVVGGDKFVLQDNKTHLQDPKEQELQQLKDLLNMQTSSTLVESLKQSLEQKTEERGKKNQEFIDDSLKSK